MCTRGRCLLSVRASLGVCCENACGQMGGCTLCACMWAVGVGAFCTYAYCRVCMHCLCVYVLFGRAHILCVCACVHQPVMHMHALCVYMNTVHCTLCSRCVFRSMGVHTLWVCIAPSVCDPCASPLCVCVQCVCVQHFCACTLCMLCVHSVHAVSSPCSSQRMPPCRRAGAELGGLSFPGGFSHLSPMDVTAVPMCRYKRLSLSSKEPDHIQEHAHILHWHE